MQEKVLMLEKSSAALNLKFVTLLWEAEKSKDMALKIAGANALKRKSEEHIVEKKRADEAIKVVEAKRRKP